MFYGSATTRQAMRNVAYGRGRYSESLTSCGATIGCNVTLLFVLIFVLLFAINRRKLKHFEEVLT